MGHRRLQNLALFPSLSTPLSWLRTRRAKSRMADGRSLFVYVVIAIWGTNSNGHTQEEEDPARTHTLK